MDDLQRPTKVRRIPTLLIHDELAALLAQMSGVESLMGKLLYGYGMPGSKHGEEVCAVPWDRSHLRKAG